MSKSTIVSLYPLEFSEFIPFIFPSHYYIPPSDCKTPNVLVVEDAYYFIDHFVGDRPSPIKVYQGSDKLAYSIINDFLNSSAYADDAGRPAVFYLEGEHSPAEILSKHKVKVESEIDVQKNWFIRLVKKADDEWQISRQHKMISDLQRFAAKMIGVENRDWLFVTKEFKNCPACGAKVSIDQAICQCRCIINEAAYKALKFAGV